MKSIKKIALLVIPFLPLNYLRILAYRLIFSYTIEDSTIGFGTKLDCKEVHLKKAKVGRDNLIQAKKLIIADGSIGNYNSFQGIEDIHLENASIANKNDFCGLMSLSMLGYSNSYCNIGNSNRFLVGAKTDTVGTLKLQPGAKITSSHIFDVVCDIVIGRKTVIAGRESQFWTHGIGIKKNIEIGEICYVGSASRFAPGSKIGNNILVGMGSVVTKRIECDNAMIAGVPARIIKENYDFRSKDYLSSEEI